MGRAPAFQWYPGDWFREPGLKRVGLSVRGAWAELLMIMHDEKPRGKVSTHLEGFARTWRVSEEEAAFIIQELDENKIADVYYCDENCRNAVQKKADAYRDMSPKCPDVSPNFPDAKYMVVTIVNRRMAKEEKEREYERLKKQKQREKKEVPNCVLSDVPEKSLLHSSSSSSTSSSNTSKDYKEVSPPLSDTELSDDKKAPTSTRPDCPHEEIISLYHEILPQLPHVIEWGEGQRKILRARWREKEERRSLDWWRWYFGLIRASPWLMGEENDWRADLEWVVRPKNMAKILNGRYHRQKQKYGKYGAKNMAAIKGFLEGLEHEGL